MTQENYKVKQAGSVLLNLLAGSVCMLILTVMMISKGFDIPIKSWPWLIGCWLANIILQGFLHKSTQDLTR